MKITKARLKQIIKEELEVTLTNEEATEMFGEAVGAQLEEQELNEVDMSQVQIIMDAFAQIGLNLSPAVIMGLMGYAFKQAIDADKEIHKSFDKRRRGFAEPEDEQMMEQEKVAADVERATKSLERVTGFETMLRSIDSRAKFEQLLNKFIQMVAKEKLKPNDVKMGVRNVAAAILKGK